LASTGAGDESTASIMTDACRRIPVEVSTEGATCAGEGAGSVVGKVARAGREDGSIDMGCSFDPCSG
jgi:hypothetical protein